jgi:phosphotransferase system HPr-like phosphotransfer protein
MYNNKIGLAEVETLRGEYAIKLTSMMGLLTLASRKGKSVSGCT